MAASALGSLAGAGLSAGLGALFGDEPDLSGILPSFNSIQGPGFNVLNDNGNFRIQLSGNVRDALNEFKRLSRERAGEISGLLPSVAPGMGALTASRLAQVEQARERAIGQTARDQTRRGVAGSSFGAENLADIERRFGLDKAQVAAVSFLEELELTNNLMRERTQTLQQGLTTDINTRMNASTAGQQAITSMMGVMSSNARLLAEAQMQQAIGQGQMFGLIGSTAGDFLGSLNFGNLFGGGGGGVPISPFGGATGFGRRAANLALI